jgi:lipid-A-disaccharide synthase
MGHGGDSMKKAGMQILEHSDTLSIMGFFEVLKHLPRMIKIMDKTISAIKRVKPDRIILIDYPGFNLRLAKRIKHLNIPITYFILPQAWAWKENRVQIMQSLIDQSLSILPFEQNWFEQRGLTTNYVGHPFSEEYHVNETSKDFYQRHNLSYDDPILLLLPGSRQQEIDQHWPIFIKTIDELKTKFSNLQIIVGQAPNVQIFPLPDNIKVEHDSRKAMVVATAALVSSGTATLECAVEDTPLVVCYKLSGLSWALAKQQIKVNYVSLVNIIADKNIVPEVLQKKMTVHNLCNAISPLLNEKSNERKIMLSGFEEVRKSLGVPGVYKRAAEAIIGRTIK